MANLFFSKISRTEYAFSGKVLQIPGCCVETLQIANFESDRAANFRCSVKGEEDWDSFRIDVYDHSGSRIGYLYFEKNDCSTPWCNATVSEDGDVVFSTETAPTK